MNATDATSIRQIFQSAASTGATLPGPVVAAHERSARLAAAVRGIGPRQDDLAVAVVAALDAHRDPTSDDGVRRVLLARDLATDGLHRGVDSIAIEGTTRAMTEHRDEVVEAFREPFSVAATALTNARTELGPVALEDTAAILAKGGNAAAAFAAATNAVTTIRDIDDGWSALARLLHVPLDPRYPVLRIAAVAYETWVEQELERKRLTAWEAVRLDLVLSLPTVADFRERAAVIEAGHVRAQERAEEANLDALTGRQRAGSR